MFRRSNSSSQIPIATNLFNAGKTRSRSSTRGSVSTLTSTNIPKLRRSSSENKLSLNRLSRQTTPSTLSKITPRNFGGRKFSHSKTTPSSVPRSAGSSKKCPGSSQDRKTIQKLSTDKRWVADQYAKVQDFIRTSGLFDMDIVIEKDIRPPSIKTFIYIASVLLKEIFPNININNDNYKEVITAKLKVMRYPGTLANSVLKTVNTMHVWPQVVGFFGWLMDKVKLQMYSQDHSLSLMESESKQNYLVTHKFKELLYSRYLIYNGLKPDEVQKVEEEFVKDLVEILEVHPEEYNRLDKEIQQKREYHFKQDNEITDLFLQIDTVKTQNKAMVDEIEKFEEADIIEETSLNGELKIVESQLTKLKAKRITVETNLKKLEEYIEVQVCSYQEKLALEKKMDILSNKVKRKKEKNEHAENIKIQMDEKLTIERNKLEGAVIQWNTFLMEWVINKPQLKSLLLKETGFHNPAYLTELKNLLKHKTEIENEFCEKLQIVEANLKKEQAKRNKMEAEIERINQCVNDLKQEVFLLESQVLETEKAITNVNSELDLLKKACKEEMTNLQSNNLEEMIQQAKELKELQAAREEELKNFTMKTLSFFVELRKQIFFTLDKAQDIVVTSQERFNTEINNKRNEFRKYLENIKDTQHK